MSQQSAISISDHQQTKQPSPKTGKAFVVITIPLLLFGGFALVGLTPNPELTKLIAALSGSAVLIVLSIISRREDIYRRRSELTKMADRREKQAANR